MTVVEFIIYMVGLIKANGNRAITGNMLQSVLTTMSQNVVWKADLPFSYYGPLTITNSNLDGNNEYTVNHKLDCDDPVFVIRWVDNTYISGDGYFNKERVDADNTKFTFTDVIPAGNVVITAFKFKAAE